MCQKLANLCALTFYNSGSGPCTEYSNSLPNNDELKVKDASGNIVDDFWFKSFPWISYSNQAVLSDEDFNLRISFSSKLSGSSNKFNFFVTKFDIEGNFISFDELSPNFFLCPRVTSEQVDEFSKFGGNNEYVCEFSLNDANNTMVTYFYELFVRDNDGKLIDVPVQVRHPGSGSYTTVRRFFMFDNIAFNDCGNDGRYLVYASSLEPAFRIGVLVSINPENKLL